MTAPILLAAASVGSGHDISLILGFPIICIAAIGIALFAYRDFVEPIYVRHKLRLIEREGANDGR